MSSPAILFHLGLHKTATSSLQKDFFIPSQGYSQNNGRAWLLPMFVNKSSTDILSEDEINQLKDFVNECSKKNLVPVASHERLSGYPISGGYDRLSILHRIRETNLNIKIFLVIREQKAWLYSAWKQMITDGGSISLKDFLLPSNIANNVRKPIPRFDYLDYSKEIHNLIRLFGRDNICVLPMELIKHDFKQFKSTLCEFSGVPTNKVNLTSLPRINESKKMSTFYFNRFLNKYIYSTSTSEGGLLNENSRFGVKARKLTSNLANKIPEVPFSKAIIENHKDMINNVVKNVYCECNKETSRLIGHDLKEFGYM